MNHHPRANSQPAERESSGTVELDSSRQPRVLISLARMGACFSMDHDPWAHRVSASVRASRLSCSLGGELAAIEQSDDYGGSLFASTTLGPANTSLWAKPQKAPRCRAHEKI